MKKSFLLLLALTICVAILFTGCGGGTRENKDESEKTDVTRTESSKTENTEIDFEKNIVGSWMIADRNGRPAFTNEKGVITFASPTKAYISAAYNTHAELGNEWIHQLEAEVSIDGSKATLTWPTDDNKVMVDEFTISVFTETEQQGNLIVKSVDDGKETIVIEEPIRLVKVSKDYSKDILGTWEGHCISEGSQFDDGQDHRWEYKDDGTYIYYMKDGENWVPGDDSLNEYFVAGNLLCTRWMENGVENREWWEISIDGGKMRWTALRIGDDGKTFTAEFEMTKIGD